MELRRPVKALRRRPFRRDASTRRFGQAGELALDRSQLAQRLAERAKPDRPPHGSDPLGQVADG